MVNEHSEVASVISRLSDYRDRFTTILDLVGDKRKFTEDEKHHLQQLFTALKADLKTDIKRGSTIAGRASLSETERNFLHPAVSEASARIRVATNSHPSTWHSELYSARTDITYLLHQLEHPAI